MFAGLWRMKSVINLIGVIVVIFGSVFTYGSNTDIAFKNDNKSDEDWLKAVAEISLETEYVDFTKSNYYLQGFELINDLGKLKVIDFSKVKLSGEGSWIKLFTNLPDSIETLVLCGTGYKGECPELASQLPHLKNIDMSREGLSEDKFKRIKSKFNKAGIKINSGKSTLTKKESPKIYDNRTETSSSDSSRPSGIRSRQERGTSSQKPDDTIADYSGDKDARSRTWRSRIGKLSNSLEQLILNSSNYKGENACGFRKFKNLQYLDLTKCQLSLEENIDKWSELFSNLTNKLESLFLSNSNYSGAEVGKFKSWKELRELHMASIELNPSAVKWALLIENLQAEIVLLDLTNSSYSGENVIAFDRLFNLRILYLSHCKVSLDKYLELVKRPRRQIRSYPDVIADYSNAQFEPSVWRNSIEQIPADYITEIDLSGSNYQGECRDKFSSFKNLQTLILTGCRISADNKTDLIAIINNRTMAQHCTIVDEEQSGGASSSFGGGATALGGDGSGQDSDVESEKEQSTSKCCGMTFTDSKIIENCNCSLSGCVAQ